MPIPFLPSANEWNKFWMVYNEIIMVYNSVLCEQEEYYREKKEKNMGMWKECIKSSIDPWTKTTLIFWFISCSHWKKNPLVSGH